MSTAAASLPGPMQGLVRRQRRPCEAWSRIETQRPRRADHGRVGIGFGCATDDNGCVGSAEHGMPKDDGSAPTGVRRRKQPPLAPPAFWLGGLVLVLAGFTFGWDRFAPDHQALGRQANSTSASC